MAGFSVVEAAFSGLKALRARPSTALAWYVFITLGTLVSMVVMTFTVGPSMAELRTLQAGATAGTVAPQAILAASGRALLGFIWVIPVMLVIMAVTLGAASRAVMQPNSSAFGYLRFGADELRIMATTAVVGLIAGTIYIVSIFALTIVGGVVLVMMGGAKAGGAGVGLMVTIAILPTTLLFVFLLSRFALAPAQSLDTRSINVFGSWSLTKGSAGKTLLTFLLAFAVYLAAYLIAMLAALAFSSALGNGVPGMLKMLQPDYSSLRTLMTLPMAVYVLITSFLGVMSTALFYCPGAFIYEALTEKAQLDVF